MGPVDFIGFHASFHPDRLAVIEVFSGRQWTYAELNEEIGKCASVLGAAYAIKPGDRVATLARNCAELLFMHFASSRIGAIYTPLNWRLTPSELRLQIDDVGPTILIGDDELSKAGLVGTQISALAETMRTAVPLEVRHLDPDRPALMLFTSGTSGKAKGAVLSERNLDLIGLNSGYFSRVTPDSRYLIDSPMFHIIGISTCVRPPLMQGGAVLISDGFDPAHTLARIGNPDLKVTHYFCVPQMATMLRQHPDYSPAVFQRLTAVFTGGAPHPEDQMKAWLDDGIPVVNAYGMSEVGSVFSMPIDIEKIRRRPKSVGIGTPAIQARVVGEDMQLCAPGTAGELQLKGDNVFLGYWPDLIQQPPAFTDDGWFQTGDIVMMKDGLYDLIDRKKEMYISGGENVYPAEVENALAGHPGITELAVIGVPDEKWGEVGHIFLVPHEGVVLDMSALHARLEASLARYKIPKHWTIIDELPRTSSGKIQKRLLRDRLTSAEKQLPCKSSRL